MSAMTFSQKTSKARAPDKGSFPLDTEGVCKVSMAKYMRCLRLNKMENAVCRQESKEYLECRMNNNLMQKEEWEKLGYRDLSATVKTEEKS